MAGFSPSLQDSQGAELTLVPLCSLIIVPPTGGGGRRMWGDSTMLCSQTAEGGIHVIIIARQEKDANSKSVLGSN